MDEQKKMSAKEKLDNIWYHYKFHICMAAVAIITVVICVTQLVTKDESDYYAIYAGPEIFAYQDVKYIERALASVGEDRTGDKQVTVTLKDIVMLSPEELEEAKAQGAKFNNEFLQTSMTEFNQQIFTGDSVICLLSPYMYENVHEEGGFLPLSEIFDEIPDSAYDDCGIILSETDFGKDFQGINALPDNTILCMRRISTMSAFESKKKSEKQQQDYIALFRSIVSYTSEETD